VSDADPPSAPALAQPPAVPRDAATVVLLRDGAKTGQGIEVYLIKRARTVDFMAGAHVFPGGRLDRNDSSASACALLSAATASLQERLGEALPPMQAAGLYVAAIRETFEEAGLLLGRLAAGWATGDARAAVAGGAQFATLMESIDAAALVPWVRWVTPEISPRRFDARFFLARAPAGQEPVVDGREATEGLWITPMAALGRWLDGDMQLAPATAKCLDALLAYATAKDALASATGRPPPVMMPTVWNDKEDGRAYISLPGDPRHPVRVDALGGRILRLQLETGQYRPVTAAP
jgi:8-oxo-dGTP pyrophosphatase MutT (NUDIX family)